MFNKPKSRALTGTIVVSAALLAAGCSGNPLDSFKSGPSTSDVTFIGAAETWDLNRDSIVTCDEWKQYAGSALSAADGDGDGALTKEEYAVMTRTDRLFQVAGMGHYDANSDGRVTKEELTGKRSRAFELLDKNNDCKIERDEKVIVRYQKREKPKDNTNEAERVQRGR